MGTRRTAGAMLSAGAAVVAGALLVSCASAGRNATTGSEPFRPQLHFSPARHWMNDPNGLVYFEGEYHLFFQYNPQGETWGHMSWGHAVSTDLVHWRELPVAIPEDDRYMIFSGSIVIDNQNSSGFARDGNPVMVAVYTGAAQPDGSRQNQQLAYSTDRGRSWTKYVGNPVLDIGVNGFRDPKVFWYEPDHQWIVAAVLADQHQVAFFSSSDLKHWTHLSDFGPAGATDGAWECPDVFALPIDGDPARTRWVLKVDVFRSQVASGSGAQYFTGSFDGHHFLADLDPAKSSAGALAHGVDYGMDFYAAASWGSLPDRNRHVWIAWMNNHGYAQQLPTSAWRGTMSLPRQLALHADGDTLMLEQRPVVELQALRDRTETYGPREIGYDTTTQTLFVDRAHSGEMPSPAFAQRQSAPLKLEEGRLLLHVYVDASSVEVFADEGQRVFTEQVFPDPRSQEIEIYADGGHARVKKLQLWELKSAGR